MRSRDDYDLVVFYEDILSDKEKVCKELLEVCDIPLEYVPEASKFENELFKFYLIRHFQCKTDHKTFLDLSHTYRVRRLVIRKVLSTRIWGGPPARGPLL